MTENGEHGASATCTIDSGAGSWYIDTACSHAARIASRSSTTSIRWQATLRLAEVHRSPARVKAQSYLLGRFHFRSQQVAAVLGEQVVVVGGRGASRQRQRAERCAGRVMFELRVQVTPDGVQRGQPLEQRRVLRVAASDPLVEVVMDVDQTRGGQAPRTVDTAGTIDGWCRAAGHGVDPAVTDHEVPAGELAVLVIDRRDRAAVDDQWFPGHAELAEIGMGPPHRRESMTPSSQRPGVRCCVLTYSYMDI